MKSLVPITLPADPTDDMHAATKQYVDDNAGGGTVFTVDAGTPTYDDSSGLVLSWTSKWGIDGSGNPYFNDAGVTSGDEAALMRDSETGAFFLRRYTPL